MTWYLLAVAPDGLPFQIGGVHHAAEVRWSLASCTLPPGWWWVLVPEGAS